MWIEIAFVEALNKLALLSPSTRRVWIEIYVIEFSFKVFLSPSTRRVWIEIRFIDIMLTSDGGHPPHGGCGLKLILDKRGFNNDKSPSTRRVWIEISCPISRQKRPQVTLHTEGVD